MDIKLKDNTFAEQTNRWLGITCDVITENTRCDYPSVWGEQGFQFLLGHRLGNTTDIEIGPFDGFTARPCKRHLKSKSKVKIITIRSELWKKWPFFALSIVYGNRYAVSRYWIYRYGIEIELMSVLWDLPNGWPYLHWQSLS